MLLAASVTVRRIGAIRLRRCLTLLAPALLALAPAPAKSVATTLPASREVTWKPVARWRFPRLVEPSALVVSRQYPGVLWTVNDSGGRAELFALTLDGEPIARVEVRGARNRDWESLALDAAGRLYIGDFGNNHHDREKMVVYVVKEPDPRRQQSVRVAQQVVFSYSRSAGEKPKKKKKRKKHKSKRSPRFDAEASFIADGHLHLLTKERGTGRSTLFRFAKIDGRESRQRLAPIDTLEVSSLVTGATMHPDGRRLAVLTYDEVLVFERSGPGAPFFSGTMQRTRLEIGQAEGIAWDGEDLLVCNEENELHRLPAALLRTGAAYVPPLPPLLPVLPTSPGGRAQTRLPLRWSRPGRTSPPGPPPADLPPARAWVGWSMRGLVVDLQWPAPPAVEEGATIALIMATAAAPHAGPTDAGECAWALRWRGPERAPGVVAPPPNVALPPAARPDCNLAAVTATRAPAPPPRWGVRLDLSAAACGGWEPRAGDRPGFNAILLGEEAAGQWSFSADASTWCWINPDLWGRLLLVDGSAGAAAAAPAEAWQ